MSPRRAESALTAGVGKRLEKWFAGSESMSHACPDNNAMNAKPRKLGFVRISAGRSQAPILPATILLESCKSCGSVILDVIWLGNDVMDLDALFNNGLRWKSDGGVPLDVFVSDGIWHGGLHESREHQPFVAIGPADWDGEEELTFFSSQSDVEDFIQRLRNAAKTAFSNS